MRRITVVAMLLALAGCAHMTEDEKRTAWIVVGVVGVVVIAASQTAPEGPVCSTHFIVGPGGSTPVTRCE